MYRCSQEIGESHHQKELEGHLKGQCFPSVQNTDVWAGMAGIILWLVDPQHG